MILECGLLLRLQTPVTQQNFDTENEAEKIKNKDKKLFTDTVKNDYVPLMIKNLMLLAI